MNSDGTATQQNARLTAGHHIVPPITASQSLGVADVIRVTNVIEAKAANGAAVTQFAIASAAAGNTAHDNNITSRYSFADGQKDNFYDHASITLKAGQTPPANNVLITFDYFSHSAANSYFSVDSYTNVDYACLLYTSPSPRDRTRSRMPSSA